MDSSSFFDSSIFSLSSEQWMALYPFLILFFGCALNTLLAAFRVSDKILKLSLLAVFGAAGFIFVRDWSQPSQFFLGNSLEIESSLRILAAIILLSAILCVLFIEGDTEERHSEWALLVNTSVLGMILLLGARNWIAFFVYLETLSIPGYILAALHTRKLHSIEAGLKYLMMGAFASSFLLLGITLIYGLAGSLDFETLQGVLMDLSSQEKLLVSVSTVILLSSFAFKVALIPFHMWAPDVYQGAPTGVAAFLGSTTKVALFGAIFIFFDISSKSFLRESFCDLKTALKFF
jgi:NADH-quinone oxidoreductase subunit N